MYVDVLCMYACMYMYVCTYVYVHPYIGLGIRMSTDYERITD